MGFLSDIGKITGVRVILSVQSRISDIHGKLRARIFRDTHIQADICAYIGALDIGAWCTIDIRGCKDNSTRTFVILRISKCKSMRISVLWL